MKPQRFDFSVRIRKALSQLWPALLSLNLLAAKQRQKSKSDDESLIVIGVIVLVVLLLIRWRRRTEDEPEDRELVKEVISRKQVYKTKKKNK